MTAEHDEPRRPVRIQPDFLHLRAPVQAQFAVEIRIDDHSGGFVNMRLIAAGGARLRDGARRPANPMLRLMRFDPEVRRVVRKVRQYGYIGGGGTREAQGLIHGAIEIRHQGHHQVRLGLRPVTAQLADQRLMSQSDQHLQDAQFLREAQSPASRQTHVVVVLGFHAGGSAKHILRVQDFEQIHQPDLPIPTLLANHALQGIRRRTMPAPRVDIDEVDCFHSSSYCVASVTNR